MNLSGIFVFKIVVMGQAQWLTPVSATQEAEIGKIKV
jgi:hypothetical protein